MISMLTNRFCSLEEVSLSLSQYVSGFPLQCLFSVEFTQFSNGRTNGFVSSKDVDFSQYSDQ